MECGIITALKSLPHVLITGLSNGNRVESQLPAQLAWDLLASPDGVPQEASQPDSFLLASFLYFLKSQTLKRSHKLSREWLRNILISFPCRCCRDLPNSANGCADSTVLKLWVLYLCANKSVFYPCTAGHTLQVSRGPGCCHCQWTQGSEDAHSLTKMLPMRNPGPTSAVGAPQPHIWAAVFSRSAKKRTWKKWQSCRSWHSQSEHIEGKKFLGKILSFFMWNLLLNRPSPFSSKAGMCLRTFWQHFTSF